MYIKIDEKGKYSFYPENMYSEKEIEDCIKISDEFYQYLINNNDKFIFDVTKESHTIDDLISKPKDFDDVPELNEPKSETEKLKEQISNLKMENAESNAELFETMLMMLGGM